MFRFFNLAPADALREIVSYLPLSGIVELAPESKLLRNLAYDPQTWIGRLVRDFGYTHGALDALNLSPQDLINTYRILQEGFVSPSHYEWVKLSIIDTGVYFPPLHGFSKIPLSTVSSESLHMWLLSTLKLGAIFRAVELLDEMQRRFITQHDDETAIVSALSKIGQFKSIQWLSDPARGSFHVSIDKFLNIDFNVRAHPRYSQYLSELLTNEQIGKLCEKLLSRSGSDDQLTINFVSALGCGALARRFIDACLTYKLPQLNNKRPFQNYLLLLAFSIHGDLSLLQYIQDKYDETRLSPALLNRQFDYVTFEIVTAMKQTALQCAMLSGRLEIVEWIQATPTNDVQAHASISMLDDVIASKSPPLLHWFVSPEQGRVVMSLTDKKKFIRDAICHPEFFEDCMEYWEENKLTFLNDNAFINSLIPNLTQSRSPAVFEWLTNVSLTGVVFSDEQKTAFCAAASQYSEWDEICEKLNHSNNDQDQRVISSFRP